MVSRKYLPTFQEKNDIQLCAIACNYFQVSLTCAPRKVLEHTESKKEGNDQKSIQSSITPYPGYQWESDNLTIRHRKREPRAQPFPSRCPQDINKQMRTNIIVHLEEHKLLSDWKYTLRKRRSYEIQLTTVRNDWVKMLDNERQMDTFILDFEKAFDNPLMNSLKVKLFSYGIGGKTLK